MAPLWGVVEIMGHRTRAGMLSDTQIGGATMLRIEHPTLPDHTGVEPLTEYYTPSAIFAIRPCSQEDATKVAESYWRAPKAVPAALCAAFDEVVDDEWDDDEEAFPL